MRCVRAHSEADQHNLRKAVIDCRNFVVNLSPSTETGILVGNALMYLLISLQHFAAIAIAEVRHEVDART